MSRVRTPNQDNGVRKPTGMQLGVFKPPPPLHQETTEPRNLVAERRRQWENNEIAPTPSPSPPPPPSGREAAWKDEMEQVKGLWKEVLDEKLITADQKITDMERTIRDMERERRSSELQVVAMRDDLLFQSKSRKALLNRDRSWREQLALIEGLWKQRLEETVDEHGARCEIIQDETLELRRQLAHVRKEWTEQEAEWSRRAALWAAERSELEESLAGKNRRWTPGVGFWRRLISTTASWRSRRAATKTAAAAKDRPRPFSAEAEKREAKKPPAAARFERIFKRTAPWSSPIKTRRQSFVSSVTTRIKSTKDPISKEANLRVSRIC